MNYDEINLFVGVNSLSQLRDFESKKIEKNVLSGWWVFSGGGSKITGQMFTRLKAKMLL
jgi:hypothetical protein